MRILFLFCFLITMCKTVDQTKRHQQKAEEPLAVDLVPRDVSVAQENIDGLNVLRIKAYANSDVDVLQYTVCVDGGLCAPKKDNPGIFISSSETVSPLNVCNFSEKSSVLCSVQVRGCQNEGVCSDWVSGEPLSLTVSSNPTDDATIRKAASMFLQVKNQEQMLQIAKDLQKGALDYAQANPDDEMASQLVQLPTRALAEGLFLTDLETPFTSQSLELTASSTSPASPPAPTDPASKKKADSASQKMFSGDIALVVTGVVALAVASGAIYSSITSAKKQREVVADVASAAPPAPTLVEDAKKVLVAEPAKVVLPVSDEVPARVVATVSVASHPAAPSAAPSAALPAAPSVASAAALHSVASAAAPHSVAAAPVVYEDDFHPIDEPRPQNWDAEARAAEAKAAEAKAAQQEAEAVAAANEEYAKDTFESEDEDSTTDKKPNKNAKWKKIFRLLVAKSTDILAQEAPKTEETLVKSIKNDPAYGETSTERSLRMRKAIADANKATRKEPSRLGEGFHTIRHGRRSGLQKKAPPTEMNLAAAKIQAAVRARKMKVPRLTEDPTETAFIEAMTRAVFLTKKIHETEEAQLEAADEIEKELSSQP